MEDAQLDRLTTNLYKRYNQVFDLVFAYRNDSDEKNEKAGLAAACTGCTAPRSIW